MIRRTISGFAIGWREAGVVAIVIPVSMIAMAVGTAIALAEISPEFRRKAQDGAPEALMIRVERIRESCRDQDCSFDIIAEVLCTLRSATGLRTGDRLRIWYKSNFERSGSPAPRLVQGNFYPAFLRLNDGNDWFDWWIGRYYKPSASSSSFSPIIDLTGKGLERGKSICQY